MIEQWLSPLCQWLGLGFTNLLILVLIIVVLVKGD